eukprot:4061856-Prymnesium_polylepis.1
MGDEGSAMRGIEQMAACARALPMPVPRVHDIPATMSLASRSMVVVSAPPRLGNAIRYCALAKDRFG